MNSFETNENENLKGLSGTLAQHGFKLEFETAAIFNKFPSASESGALINHIIYNRSREKFAAIDVYAKIKMAKDASAAQMINIHFIIECKGTKKENKLVLIEQSDNGYKYFSSNSVATDSTPPIRYLQRYYLISTAGQNLIPSEAESYYKKLSIQNNYLIYKDFLLFSQNTIQRWYF